MTHEVIPGVCEDGTTILSKKPKITRKRDVLIVFKGREEDTSAIQTTTRVLNHLLSEVKTNFEDKIYRQIFFFNFKEALNKLWELSKNMENENFKEGISLLEDAVSNLKSEQVELNQLDALERVLKMMSKADLTDDNLITCDRILFEAEIYTIPPVGKIWEE